MEITNNAVQTVTAGNNVVFDSTAVSGGTCIVHREGSGLVTLRGLTNTQCRARFRVSFGANIAVPTGGTAGAISMAISINGEPVQTSSMITTPAAVNEYHNVYASIFIDVPKGCCTQVSVENTSAVSIDVQNANLIVERVA